MIHILEIKKLILSLYVGVEEDELSNPQDIEFNITIFLAAQPKACHSDHIEDTLCYAKITDIISLYCLNKKFHLIEYLCLQIFQQFKNNILSKNDKLIVQICKKPPLNSVKDKCCFTIKDEGL